MNDNLFKQFIDKAKTANALARALKEGGKPGDALEANANAQIWLLAADAVRASDADELAESIKKVKDRLGQ